MFENMKFFSYKKSSNNWLTNVLYNPITGSIFFGINLNGIPLSTNDYQHIKNKLSYLVKSLDLEENVEYSLEILDFI
jgi:hypothetical protein